MKSYDVRAIKLFGSHEAELEYTMRDNIDGENIITKDFKKVIAYIRKNYIEECEITDCDFIDCVGCDKYKLCRYFKKIKV